LDLKRLERSGRLSREAIDELIDRWMGDPGFRAEVRQDPEAAVRSTGLELDPAEWAAIRSIDWRLSDDELMARSSKRNGCIFTGI
jgi:hypothetical protein